MLGIQSLRMWAKPLRVCADWSFTLPFSQDLCLSVFLDSVSLSFIGSVAAVAAAVLTFSSSYMSQEKYFIRFHLLVLGFIASIFALIASPNLVSLLLGWDGLGITSFLLVVYFQSTKSNNAGILTVLTNRLGDVIILVTIGLLGALGEWSIFIPREAKEWVIHGELFLLLALAAFTKSAQRAP